MTVQEWLNSPGARRAQCGMDMRYPAVCADGFTLSIQASKFHYCTPRLDNQTTYTAVEIGYPDDLAWPDYLEQYVDEGRVVATYVPIALADRWVAEHGGIRRKGKGNLPALAKADNPDE